MGTTKGSSQLKGSNIFKNAEKHGQGDYRLCLAFFVPIKQAENI